MNRVLENEQKTAYLATGHFSNHTLLEQCISDVTPLLLERPEIIVFGKVRRQQRYVGFFSNTSCGYHYSNKLMKSISMTDALSELLQTVNQLFVTDYNGILVNKYMDGNDCIGAHSDDESGLDMSGVIAISYGAERTFRIRSKSDNKIIVDIPTKNCGIIQMGGDFQKLYKHEIPVQKRSKNRVYPLPFANTCIDSFIH